MVCATPWPSKFHFERFASPTRCSDRRRRGSRLGIKTTKLTRRCFSILVWEVRGHGVYHTLGIEIPFRALSVTDPLLGQTPAGGEAGDSKNQIDQTIFMNSRLRGAWVWRVPHPGLRHSISIAWRHRSARRPDAGGGRGWRFKKPN